MTTVEPGRQARAFLWVLLSLACLVGGSVLGVAEDGQRSAHLRAVAVACGQWQSFPMPVAVFVEGWCALLLLGAGAWLVAAQLTRPWFLTTGATHRTIVITLRIATVLLLIASVYLLAAGVSEVYDTHQAALPMLVECGP